MNPDRTLPWDWYPGRVPENVVVDPEAYLETTYSFQLFRSAAADAVRIGRGSSIYLGVMFDVGTQGRVRHRRLHADQRRTHHLRWRSEHWRLLFDFLEHGFYGYLPAAHCCRVPAG